MVKGMDNYRCDVCGCYLDPGEWDRCDECRKEEMHGIRRKKELDKIQFLIEGDQVNGEFEK